MVIFRKSKGVSPIISYILVVLLIFAGLSVVLTIGMPVLDRSRQVASFQRAQEDLLSLDSKIREVSSYGRGTLAEFSLSTDHGTYNFVPANDTFYFEVETDAEIISPGAHRRLGAVNMSGREHDGSNLVKLELDYSDENINLTEMRGRNEVSFSSGYYTLVLDNKGVENGKVRIDVGIR